MRQNSWSTSSWCTGGSPRSAADRSRYSSSRGMRSACQNRLTHSTRNAPSASTARLSAMGLDVPLDQEKALVHEFLLPDPVGDLAVLRERRALVGDLAGE